MGVTVRVDVTVCVGVPVLVGVGVAVAVDPATFVGVVPESSTLPVSAGQSADVEPFQHRPEPMKAHS